MSDNTTNLGDGILNNMENNATDASTNNDITPSADSIGQFLTEIRNYVSRNHNNCKSKLNFFYRFHPSLWQYFLEVLCFVFLFLLDFVW